MASKVKPFDGFLRKRDVEAMLAREREATIAFVNEALEKALSQFYEYLLKNGHLRPTEQLDTQVRAMIDSGEIKPNLSIVSR